MPLKSKVCIFILLILFLDQVSKIWVKTHMVLGQDYAVFGDWFYILFTENPGMAFGVTLGNGTLGKLLLTAFRLLMTSLIAWFIGKLLQRNIAKGLVIGLAAVFAGAMGNIIDSIFYGVFFTDSLGEVARLLPPEGGYETFFFGNVVDMFYFPIIETQYPSWFPYHAGRELIFFHPIFNVADIAISVGIFYIILFQRRSLHVLISRRMARI